MSDSPRAPLLLRLAERPRSSPLRIALAIGLALVAAFLALEIGLGRTALLMSDAHVAADFQVGFALCALVAYLSGAFAGGVRGAERSLLLLAPAFAQREDAALALADVTGRVETPLLRRVGIAGIAVALLIPIATNLGIETWFLHQLPPEAIVHRALLIPLGWLAPRSGLVVWRESRRLSVLGASALRVDLLDLRPLAPLASAGLRHALLNAGLLSVLVIGFQGASVAPGLPYVVASAFLASLVLTLLAAWFALRGGHQAITREKARAEADANARIRALQAAGAQVAPGALADLLAWRAHLARLPDWPVDLPALQRFVLPLALPLASLLAGALLEKLLGRWLG
jgi:hypothetical protein